MALRGRSKAEAQGRGGLGAFKEGKWRPVGLKGGQPGQSGWGGAGEAGGLGTPPPPPVGGSELNVSSG